MKHLMKAVLIGAVVSSLGALAFSTAGPQSNPGVPENPPRIQIAILLDTSNSMDGLIDQAKSQLWRVVNEFATIKKAGRRPALEVALYEYGKSSLPAEQGYIRQILSLTTTSTAFPRNSSP